MPFPDDPDDDAGFIPPLPPDDRLWRHPSEMSAGTGPGVSGPGPTPRPVHQYPDHLTPGPNQSRQLILASVAMLAAVALTLTVLAMAGTFSGRGTGGSHPIASGPAADDFGSAFAVLAPSIVRIDTARAGDDLVATGIVVRSNGYIVTTSDAVDAATAITITVHDGTAYNATIVGVDRADDVAVLHIERDAMVVAVVAPSRISVAEAFVVAHSDTHDAPWIASEDIDTIGTDLATTDGQVMHGMTHGVVDVAMPSRNAIVGDVAGHVIGIVTARQPTIAVRISTTSMAIPFSDRGVTPVWSTPIDRANAVADEIIGTTR